MRNPTNAQVLHINRMFLASKLSRLQFEEFNKLAETEALTYEIAQAIIEGRYEFKMRLSDAHLVQARRLFEKFGKALGGINLEQYLNGTDSLEAIPLVPTWSLEYPGYLDRDVLIDTRVVERHGLEEFCRLAGAVYNGTDTTFVPYDDSTAKGGVYWARMQTGRRNRNKAPATCRTEFASNDEVGGNAVEGVTIWIHDPKVIGTVQDPHYMDLPGSVRAENRGRVACFGIIDGRPRLYWDWHGVPHPYYGSVSRGKL